MSGIPSSAGRDNIKSMGRSLINENLLYTPLKQINYNSTSSTWVYPADLTQCRCDGVVEYCYEYYGYRVFGNDSYWDISRMGDSYKNQHALATVTPETQANNYMLKWFPTGRTICLINQNSGLGLDVNGPSSANGTNLIQWQYNATTNQQFKLEYTYSGAFYSFVPQNATSSAIEIQNNSSTNGTVVQIWEKQSWGYMDSQKFRLNQNANGSYDITTYGSGYTKVIDVGGAYTNNGASVNIWDANGSATQHWFFVPA